jgi:tryptophan 7-halogenase
MPDNRIENIVIVGGGTAGWMAAAGFSQYFRNLPVNITLIESSDIGTVGVGEATIPTILDFTRELGIDDFELMRATQATCKLGIEFKDWYKIGSSFFHPFGLYGQEVRSVPFHHYWLKSRQSGSQLDISEYSLPCVLADLGRMERPSPTPQSQLDVYDWALHFDATLFAGFMREYAEHRGVHRIDQKIIDVELRPEDGFIQALRLENGERVAGDFFIDCSGFRALLIEGALNTGYENWSHWLPCDSAAAVICEGTENPTPYTQATARKAGWQWRIPLQHRIGNGHVYSSPYISDDEATSILLNNIEGKPLTDPRILKFTTGRRKKFWNKNCVALGLAAGFMEPLESTSIAVINTAIENLRKLFPDKSFNQSCADEFNRRTTLEFEQIRDFLILHYNATQRDDSPFWNDIRTMDIPESLNYKLKIYRARGLLVKDHWETFHEPSWLAILCGHHIYPDTFDPVVDFYDNDNLERSLDRIRTAIRKTAESAPKHGEFITRHCAINRC